MTRRKLKTPKLFLQKRQKMPWSSQNEIQRLHPFPRKIKWRPLNCPKLAKTWRKQNGGLWKSIKEKL
jgi:hypothetical protein